MELLNLVAVLVVLTAVFSYLNHRYIGLPASIGVMLIALALSAVLNRGRLGISVRPGKARRRG